MDCSPPGSSVHGILQARTLERVAMSNFRGASPPRDGTRVSCASCNSRHILYHWATREAPQEIIQGLHNLSLIPVIGPEFLRRRGWRTTVWFQQGSWDFPSAVLHSEDAVFTWMTGFRGGSGEWRLLCSGLAWASPGGSFSRCEAGLRGGQAQQLRYLGLAALQHMGFSRTRDGTHIPQSNPHWQVGSYLWRHQGVQSSAFLTYSVLCQEGC